MLQKKITRKALKYSSLVRYRPQSSQFHFIVDMKLALTPNSASKCVQQIE